LFFKVQKRLETTRLTERTRVDNGESRVFFISGLIKCECCGRALVGHSAHGKNKVHRYYEHKRVKGEKLSCPVTRYPANEIEDAILKHLDKVLEDSGYLDQIENNIKQCMGLSKAADKSKKATLEKSIQKIEVEIENVFKLTMTMKSGSAGSDLIHDKLQKLAEKKKAMEMELGEIANAQNDALQIKSAKETILANALNLKKAMKKAKPHFQKRLFGLTFQQFLATKDGLKVFYTLVDGMKTEGNTLKNKKPSESYSEGFLNQSFNKWAKSPLFFKCECSHNGKYGGR
jgi:hypothetical protein